MLLSAREAMVVGGGACVRDVMYHIRVESRKLMRQTCPRSRHSRDLSAKQTPCHEARAEQGHFVEVCLRTRNSNITIAAGAMVMAKRGYHSTSFAHYFHSNFKPNATLMG